MSRMNKLKEIKIPSFFLLFFFVFSAAYNSTYTSKKKNYYKFDFPKKEYVKFDQPGFPYSFEYPVYATIEEDSLLSNRNGHDPYSINIDFSSLNGKIYI